MVFGFRKKKDEKDKGSAPEKNETRGADTGSSASSGTSGPQSVGTCTIAGPPSGRYNGQLIDGVPNGEGTCDYDNGDRYTGSFENGKRNGRGKQKGKIKGSGYEYEGQFKDDKFNGEGRLTMDGNIYKGTFKNGEFIHGKLTESDGTTSEGSFRDWKLNGYGKTVGQGIVIQGDMIDGKLNGAGTITFPDGLKIYGKFKDNLSDGVSTFEMNGVKRYGMLTNNGMKLIDNDTDARSGRSAGGYGGPMGEQGSSPYRYCPYCGKYLGFYKCDCGKPSYAISYCSDCGQALTMNKECPTCHNKYVYRPRHVLRSKRINLGHRGVCRKGVPAAYPLSPTHPVRGRQGEKLCKAGFFSPL